MWGEDDRSSSKIILTPIIFIIIIRLLQPAHWAELTTNLQHHFELANITLWACTGGRRLTLLKMRGMNGIEFSAFQSDMNDMLLPGLSREKLQFFLSHQEVS